jgi:hypothetical protein
MNTGKSLTLAAMTALAVAAAATVAAKTVHVSTTHIDRTKHAALSQSDGVLYDQNASETTFGAFVNHVLAPAPTVGNTSVGADDFVVTDAAGWTITGFSFNAFGPNNTAPPASISLNVYADNAGMPGTSAVCSAPATTVTFSLATHQITANLASACDLAAGTYWIAWSFDNVDLTTGVWGWWGQTATQHNQPAVWWNTGGNFGSGCSAAWGTFAQCGNYDASLHDYGFAVLGHVAGASGGLDIALGVTPYAGNPNECGSATSAEVNVGDQVNLCYTLTNNGAQTLNYQSIVDSVDGAILTFDATPIAPGQSHQYVRTIVATTDTNRTATWTGYANIASYANAAATPNFIDISATGTDLGFVVGDNRDNEFTEVTTEFPIRFYGHTSTALCISNDGFIGFDDSSCTSPGAGQDPDPGYSFNQDIPASFGINVPAFIAPMWSNLGDGPGHVYTKTTGTAPNRTFIVQWNDIASYAIATSGATFEVVLQESNDTIRFEYQATVFGNDADNGAWSTVGLQFDPNGLYTKYSYYQPSLLPNTAIQWNYTASVSATADSGSVQISAGDPTLAVAQSSLAVVVAPDGNATSTLAISNEGNRDLHWSLGEAPGGTAAHFPKHARYVSRVASTASMSAPGSTYASLDAPTAHGTHAPLHASGANFAVPMFAISALRPGLTTFDALDPAATYTPLGNSDDWIYSATFIGNDFSKLWVIINDSWMYEPGTYGTLDTVTGAFTEVGVLTGATTPSWGGLVQDPLTGSVYAINFDDSNLGNAGSTLYTLDFATGRATRIGTIDGPGLHPVHYISGIAISPAGLMYGLDLYGQSLIAIDKSNGAARVIESLGLNVQFVQDLKFDPQTGDLYWASLYIDGSGNPVGEMRVIDPLTAASQGIGLFPAAGEYPIDEMSAIAIAKPTVGCSAPGDVPWLSVGTASGTIVAGGAAANVSVNFDATGLAPGLHQATICVFSDDPHHQAIAVPVALAVSQATPLYDQTVADTPLHAFNNTVVAPAETEGLSAEGADDFVVAGNGWSLSGFNFTAYGNAGNPLPPRVNLRVLADDGAGRPVSDATCSADNVPAIALATPNQIGVYLPHSCHLAPGTWWVAWSFANVNIASPILGFWGEITEQHNQLAVWRNPGGMLGTGCSVWSTFAQCPNQFDPSAKDFAFSVYGANDAFNCADVIFRNGFDDGTSGCTQAATKP